MKIAVFVPNRPHFGNMITQIPFLQSLKEEYKDSEVVVFSKFDIEKFWLSTGLVDHVINYKKDGLLTLVNNINRGKFDAVYNLYSGSDKVHLAIKLSNVSLTFGHSCRGYHKFCYKNHVIINKGEQYVGNSHLKLMNKFTNKNYTVDLIKKIATDSDGEKNQLTLLPGGGAGDFKRWSIDNYLMLLSDLSSVSGIEKVNFILGSDEEQYIEKIPKSIHSIDIEIHMMPSITDMVEIGQKTVLAIANDCGPAHIFQMMGCPMVTLWGWQTPTSSPYDTMREWLYVHEYSIPLTPPESSKHITSVLTRFVIPPEGYSSII